MLIDTQITLKNSLRLSGISNWDYWGMAPDSNVPKAGNTWPIKVSYEGSREVIEFFVSAGFYGVSLAAIAPEISGFLGFLRGAYGPQAQCDPEMASKGISTSLSQIDIGLPSTSAASSNRPEGSGVWVAVSFTLTLSS
jgi:hypothetical protein